MEDEDGLELNIDGRNPKDWWWEFEGKDKVEEGYTELSLFQGFKVEDGAVVVDPEEKIPNIFGRVSQIPEI